MDMTRRKFIKTLALNSAVVTAGAMFPGISFGAWKKTDVPSGGIHWKKTPCRFCGTGCGLLVGVSGDRAVAVKGDPNCSVNKGLCCVKGYHSVQILYGKDRIRKAQVRKNGKLVEVLTNASGETWSIIITSPQGVSCLVATGEGWRKLEPQLADPKI